MTQMKNAMYKFMARLAVEKAGLTAVEYAVLGGLIVAGLTTITATFTTELGTKFNNILP